ncbi:MAG TPA: hypothetical protein VFL84_04745 [Gammaproteobacteria bacterium]|nr:hypothetical protein [Gammaproteobacteria bacterium]
MGTDSRDWAHHELDEAARAALNEGLAASALWSVLLGVMERRARRKPAALLEQWRQDRFVQPCAIDQRTLHELDSHLLAAASAFEAIELAPLAPLGVCSSVAVTSQNRIVSTARGTEVVSDPTNVLALESVRRLRENPAAEIKLATSHRCTRAQAVPDKPGFAAHFRIFCLTSAAHERKDHAFVTDALHEHIRTHCAALERLEQHGYSFAERTVKLLSTPARRHLAERIAAALSGIPVTHAELEHGYYDGLRFMIDVTAPDGARIPLVDGGAFDWLRTLGANDKLTFVASGMGSQVAAYAFRRS